MTTRVLTPLGALEALVTALEAQGLTKATSHMGVAHQGSPKLDRSFAVIPDGGSLTGPGKRQIGPQGVPFEARFIMELGHILKPKSDQTDAYDTALVDLHRACAAVNAAWSNNYGIGTVRHNKEAGGQYLVTTCSVTVKIRLNMGGPS